MNRNHLLGYQIMDMERKIPDEFSKTEVLSMQLVDFWVKNFTERKDWLLCPIYVGDIPKPRLLDLEDPPTLEEEDTFLTKETLEPGLNGV